MSKELPLGRRHGPPHNPGVRDLVESKRRSSSPPQPEEPSKTGFRGWHERGYLPHRDEPGLTQFITFRLSDGFPRNLRSEWATMMNVEDDRERRKQLEAYLDQGRGECHLRQKEIAACVDGAIRFYDKRCYDLLAWVVMPNHVHLLVRVTFRPLSLLVRDLKCYTARRANKILRRCGEFWAEDYWDTFMRNGEHQMKACHYIENNPLKAFLVQDPKEWPWSSARFRDQFGILHL